ncbi:MAG: UDP-N-acetylmuramoyl-L-alanyl-D-glutamate--2,6-diaminopimelate ligase [Chromatiaceae bacterium]|nr:UDP-N-acetylmuramoyl-L-alanyl-D-glutamate--2,6-diaminopimelate ligase [Chromatiaceae bacterium]MCF8004834.1 UDP-N-acetylmuramoyl-L-alanyl-D-glutamate--2,6-diaminopimelate ligase [Chromatiaceae bacterium]
MSTDPLHEVINACRFTEAPDLDALNLSGLTDIQWRADRCTPSSILCFQRFDDGRTDAEIIERYLAHSAFGALLINRPLGAGQEAGMSQTEPSQLEPLGGRPVFVTAPDAWGETLERLCDHFYPTGPAQWQIAGVTGTNGKTTTIKYLEAILLAAGRKVLSIGTLGLSLNGQPLAETGFTSPPYIELRRILSDCRAEADTLVMEVSSHALHQGRVQGLRFAAAAWTNFSQDHLDYHGDEASYFAAKAMILDQLADGVPLFTTSAEVERRLRVKRGPDTPVIQIEAPVLPAETSRISSAAVPEAKPSVEHIDAAPTIDVAPMPARGSTPLPAEALQARPFLALSYNRDNYALACALATRLLGSEPEAPWHALQPVAGRFDCFVHQQRTIVIDFAHTPDALENILRAIREAFPQAKILTLFGCGGDRDRSKRPLMGAAVCRGSDQVILTSDNPRFEEPQAIADDTLAGMRDCPEPPTLILDRAEAIAALFDHLAARPDDESWVALIAGKGHEPYLDQQGMKRPYSDRDQVQLNLRRLGWEMT